MLKPLQKVEQPVLSKVGTPQLLGVAWYLLLGLPAVIYVLLVPRWSLDLDEIYTLRDSSKPLLQIFGYEKPLYYLICHGLLKSGLPDLLAIRLPAAIAAGLLAPVTYGLVRRYISRQIAVCTAILVAANPWYFQLSQFGRFYSLVVLLSLAATLFLYGFLQEGRWRWLWAAIGSAGLATAAHTTAVVLFPAGAIAFFMAAVRRHPRQSLQVLRRFWLPVCLLGGAAICLLVFLVRDAFLGWYQAPHGRYGNYSLSHLVMGFLIFTGLQVWALGLLPLMKPLREWQTTECFFASLLFFAMTPLLVLSPIGGGVAPRYLLAATPSLFVLAGFGWYQINSQLAFWAQRVVLAAVILVMNVPMALSTLSDGNHCDYRSAVAFVENCDADNPIVFCTAHELYRYYANQNAELYELHTLADWSTPPSRSAGPIQNELLDQLKIAEQTGRELFLVSREDRRQFQDDVQRWIAQNFRLMRTIEAPRYDHRRNQVAIYTYRPQ